jgi:hypothetical protein
MRVYQKKSLYGIPTMSVKCVWNTNNEGKMSLRFCVKLEHPQRPKGKGKIFSRIK